MAKQTTSGAAVRAPVDRIERRAISTLVPYARNPRLHSPEQIKLIAASMREHGQTQLIICDERGEVIAGHGRIMAAEAIGLKSVMVGVAVGWSEAQKRAYRIKDNQLALSSTWDEQLLSTEVRELLQVDEYNLSLLGFGGSELALLSMDPPAEGANPEAVPELPSKPVVRSGELWLLGKHRLLCGDATSKADVERLLDGAKPPLMVTDPPYGVAYDPKWRNRVKHGQGTLVKNTGVVRNDHRVDWSDAYRLFPGRVMYVWHAGLFSMISAASVEAAGFDIRCQIIWNKQLFVIGRGDYHWRHEPCWYAVRRGQTGYWCGDRKQTSVWDIAASRRQADDGADGHTNHSTQKPIECMRRPMENNSKPGDAVYEPFCGSGTTIIAAEMTARRCFAIEIDPAYVQMAVERWQNFTGKKAVLDGDGRSLNAIRQERQRPDKKKSPPKRAPGVVGSAENHLPK